MPTFRYRAIDRSGQQTAGEIAAADEAAAGSLLAERGLFADEIRASDTAAATSVRTVAKKTSKLKLSERARVELVGDLATALQAQLTLLTALEVVGQQRPHGKVRQLLAEVREIVRSGQSLSYAMSQYPRTFDRLHLAMVRVGESAGRLDQSMAQLSGLIERDLETRSSITTAALYPAFVMCLGLISAVIVVTWVLPQIMSTLAADAATLAWPTRTIMAISSFLRLYGWMVTLGLLAAFEVFRRWKGSTTGRYYWDRVKLCMPLLGPLRRKWAMSRFARTLGSLTQEGVNIIEALQIVRNTMGNEVLAREVDALGQQLRSGSSMAEPLRRSGHFPALLVQIVAVGEQTGGLAGLLLKAANAFDKDTDVAMKRFMAIFPAVLILLLAGLVGFIVAATLLPIVQMETGIPGL